MKRDVGMACQKVDKHLTENESLPYLGHPCVRQQIRLPQPERLKQKDWKPREQIRRGHYYAQPTK